jgi:hypothetical protein
MFHHCQTLHYTPPNKTDRQRRAFAIHYMPLGTSRVTRDAETDVETTVEMPVSFGRPILRVG